MLPNFLKVLFGKHDSAVKPGTLQQAQVIIETLKANGEKIGELFMEAGLDVEALLAKGKTALKDQIIALARLPAGAKADLAAASAETAEGIAKLRQAAKQAESILGTVAMFLGIKPSELAAKSQDDLRMAFNNLVAVRATEKLGELGFPEGKLPAADPATGAGEGMAHLTGMARVRHAIANMPGGSGGPN
jgi:hypothetical protein